MTSSFYKALAQILHGHIFMTVNQEGMEGVGHKLTLDPAEVANHGEFVRRVGQVMR